VEIIKNIIVIAILPFFTTWLVLKKIMVRNNNIVLKANFLGAKIPAGGGIVLMLSFGWYLIAMFAICFTSKPGCILNPLDILFYNFLFYISFLLPGLGGIIDDIYGGQTPKGLKGHFKYLLSERKISTGILKIIFLFIAVIIFIFCLKNNFGQEEPLNSFTQINSLIIILVIMLFANFFNLLDLRPGRTVKTFLLFIYLSLLLFLPILPYYLKIWEFIFFAFLGPVIISILIYLPYDLSGKIMLGDAGSNFLGFIMGAIIVILYPLPLQIGWLVFLIIVHIYAEKYSISDLIESNKFLLFFDNLFLPKEIIEKKRQIYKERIKKF